MKRATLLFALALASLTFTVNDASAQVSIGAGLKGGLNAAFVDGVDENQAIPFGNGSTRDPNIYAMFGLGGAMGLTIEPRFMGFMGVETGLHYSWDNGKGWEDINDGRTGVNLLRVTQKQKTTSLRIPFLLKFVVPSPLVRPTFGLGLEYVIQSSSTIEYDYQLTQNPRAIDTSSYPLVMATIGAEFQVGPVRIPLELRAGYNVAFDNTASERVTIDGSPNINAATITYDGAYQGHAAIFTGVIYDYDLLF